MNAPEEFPAPFQMYPYLTVIPTRRPKLKLHTNLGHAKNAIGSHIGYDRNSSGYTVRGGDLYEWNEVDHNWRLLFSVPRNHLSSQLPWKKVI